ncbi:hypothetical protein BU16DRAFT_558947 [Lophium mytilinum]|uniref:Uncharacterized protein n=1 Tax=Lophium mytilinum TaxID=390894 RepID=A0A6A6R2B6_9PEZI|nr:hypothetical protein BU16DRAFT_558947 [Lophium mytilinum]
MSKRDSEEVRLTSTCVLQTSNRGIPLYAKMRCGIIYALAVLLLLECTTDAASGINTEDWLVSQNKDLALAGTIDLTLGIDYAGGIRMYGFAGTHFTGATIWRLIEGTIEGEYTFHAYDDLDNILAVAGNNTDDYVSHMYPSQYVSTFIGNPIGSWQVTQYDDGSYAFFVPGTNAELSLAIRSDNIAEISSDWENGSPRHIWYPQVAIVTSSIETTITLTSTSFLAGATGTAATVTVGGETITAYSVQSLTVTETVTVNANVQRRLHKRSDPTLTSYITSRAYETVTQLISGIVTITEEPVTIVAVKTSVFTETHTEMIGHSPSSASGVAPSSGSSPATAATTPASTVLAPPTSTSSVVATSTSAANQKRSGTSGLLLRCSTALLLTAWAFW